MAATLVDVNAERPIPANLLVREIELEVAPAAERYGLGIIPWSPLGAVCWAA